MRRWVADQRGAVLLFTAIALVTLIAVIGFAADIAYVVAARTEVQRSLDAAALAGAAKLGFDGTVFADVRTTARHFALLDANAIRNPTAPRVRLDLNDGNGAAGHIVLGTWNAGGAFSATAVPSQVNAVKCRWNMAVPTTFLRMLGINEMSVSAESTAVGSLFPETLSAQCPFPLGISACSANGSPCGVFTIVRLPSGPPPVNGTNTGALVSTDPPEPVQMSSLLNALHYSHSAMQGACGDLETITIKKTLPTSLNGPAFKAALDSLDAKFRDRFSTSPTFVVKSANGAVVYNGPGWQVYVPILRYEDCETGQSITGNRKILAFSQFIVTQVIHNVDGVTRCAVNNPADTRSWKNYCNESTAPLSGAAGSWEVIFGYPACGVGIDVALPMLRRLVN